MSTPTPSPKLQFSFEAPTVVKGFPDSSVGKEFICNAGDPGSIPGSGRSAGEGIGFPLQHSWASLVVQLVKNPLVMWETWVQSLGWEDPMGKFLQKFLPTPGIGYPLQYSYLKNSIDCIVHGVTKCQTLLQLSFLKLLFIYLFCHTMLHVES